MGVEFPDSIIQSALKVYYDKCSKVTTGGKVCQALKAFSPLFCEAIASHLRDSITHYCCCFRYAKSPDCVKLKNRSLGEDKTVCVMQVEAVFSRSGCGMRSVVQQIILDDRYINLLIQIESKDQVIFCPKNISSPFFDRYIKGVLYDSKQK